MKPVFEKERNLLKNRLGFELPTDVWRHGQSIYLNSDPKTLLFKFKVLNREHLVITKNNIKDVLATYENKTWKQEIIENTPRIDALYNESKEMTKEYILAHPNHQLRLADSSGKDSLVCGDISCDAFKELGIDDYAVDFMNSSNETPHTYKYIKKKYNYHEKVNGNLTISPTTKLQINNPDKGMLNWLEEDKELYIPTVVSRICCDKYKHGKITQVLDKAQNYILFLGMRKAESPDRSEYDWDLNDRMDYLYEKTGLNKYKLTVPKNWKRFLPIINWEDRDIWLYILREGREYNEQYNMGFDRIGCLICPYMGDYEELLTQYYYPFLSKRWDNLLELHYAKKNVARRLKYSKEEFINQGKWKTGSGKEQELITRKATPERVSLLAELKGCSEDVAAKYFNRQCSCGKKMNADEIGMYLRIFGQTSGALSAVNDFSRQTTLFDDEATFSTDDIKYLCKDCFSKAMGITKAQYQEKVQDFRNGGCTLF